MCTCIGASQRDIFCSWKSNLVSIYIPLLIFVFEYLKKVMAININGTKNPIPIIVLILVMVPTTTNTNKGANNLWNNFHYENF
jgi:hypothetical protein